MSKRKGNDLLRQSVNQIICEACTFRDYCYGGMCIANKEWLDGKCVMAMLMGAVRFVHIKSCTPFEIP